MMAARSAHTIVTILLTPGRNHVVVHASLAFEQAGEKDGPACVARQFMYFVLRQDLPSVVAIICSANGAYNADTVAHRSFSNKYPGMCPSVKPITLCHAAGRSRSRRASIIGIVFYAVHGREISTFSDNTVVVLTGIRHADGEWPHETSTWLTYSCTCCLICSCSNSRSISIAYKFN